MSEEPWLLEDVPVRISIGEKTLFRPRLPLLVYSGIFTDLPPAPNELLLPALPAGAGGVYLPSRPVAGPLPPIALSHGLLQVVDGHFTRRLVAIEGGYDQYAKKWSPKTRSSLRGELRAFQKLSGGADIRKIYRRPEEVAEYLRLVRTINEKTYQAALFGYTIDDRYVASVERLARAGALDGQVLFHADRPVAFTQARSRGRWLELERVGYDAEYRKYAPGKLLLMLQIEALFVAKSHDVLDLGGGDAPYKEFFSTSGVPCAEVYYLRLAPRNLAVMGLRGALTHANRAVATVLERAGAKERVKRFLRRRAAGSAVAPTIEAERPPIP